MKTRMSRLITTTCKRCGKSISSSTRFQHTDCYAKYGRICEQCQTPEENHAMMMEQGRLMANACRRTY
jgi:predicted metal-binding protein